MSLRRARAGGPTKEPAASRAISIDLRRLVLSGPSYGRDGAANVGPMAAGGTDREKRGPKGGFGPWRYKKTKLKNPPAAAGGDSAAGTPAAPSGPPSGPPSPLIIEGALDPRILDKKWPLDQEFTLVDWVTKLGDHFKNIVTMGLAVRLFELFDLQSKEFVEDAFAEYRSIVLGGLGDMAVDEIFRRSTRRCSNITETFMSQARYDYWFYLAGRVMFDHISKVPPEAHWEPTTINAIVEIYKPQFRAALTPNPYVEVEVARTHVLPGIPADFKVFENTERDFSAVTKTAAYLFGPSQHVIDWNNIVNSYDYLRDVIESKLSERTISEDEYDEKMAELKLAIFTRQNEEFPKGFPPDHGFEFGGR